MAALSDKNISYSAGFFILIAMAVGGMMVGGILSFSVVMAMSGESLSSVSDIMGNAAYYREMQIMQSISAIFGFLIPTIFTANMLSKKPFELTGFSGRISGRLILLTVLIIACGLALSGSLGYLSYQLPFPAEWKAVFQKMEESYGKLAVGLINLDSPFELAISIVVLALVPAVSEEAFFRGGLQNFLFRSTNRFWLSVIITSLIFSAIHFSVYGFLSRVVLGIVLGLLFQYSGRLWLPIIAHFINNATAVIVMYIQKSNGRSLTEIMSDREGSYIGFLTIPVIVFLFMKFKSASSKTPPTQEEND